MTRDEELELAGLSGMAWELRDDPEALRAAADKIVDWWDARSVRCYRRRLRSRAVVLELLRDTTPRPKETA